MSVKAVAREIDEQIIDMIRSRIAGEDAHAVAKRCGCSADYVRAASNRIKNADIKESGEDLSGEYW